MPTIEYRCANCNHTFNRLVFRGDEGLTPTCPECGSHSVTKHPQSKSLFDGISPSSTLAKDRN